MTRLDVRGREQLVAGGQAVWDRIAGSRGAVAGPFSMLINVPPLAERVAAVGEYLRFRGLLPGTDRELAILAAARELGARYEWAAHEPFARREGARDEAIAAVAAGGVLDTLSAHERLLVEVVRSLYRTRSLPPDLYERALAELGREQLVELVTLGGYYGMIGFVLLAFDVDLPEGARVPF